MEILILVVALFALDVVSLRWGADSSDSLNSKEWQRREQWSGFGGYSK
jgi:hypothetical protein